jgi:hypothetical protein
MMAHAEDLLLKATRVAHQAALDDHFRIKNELAKSGITVDDFSVLPRYQLADFNSAIERIREP